MPPQRLDGDAIAKQLENCPPEFCDLVLELREFVLEMAPQVAEKIAFHSLCYYKPGSPYGVIGGNVCMIGTKPDCVHLAFLHGAYLDDPEGLLDGKGKSKRQIVLRNSADIRSVPIAKLIRAAIAYTPTA